MPLSNYIPNSRISQAGVVPNEAARPASPYEGQVIYETDTDKVLVWNGTAWVLPNNSTLGYVSSTSSFETVSTHTNFQDVGISSSITYSANRLLKVTYSCQPVANGGIQGIWYKFVCGSTDLKTFETTSSVYPNTVNAFSCTFTCLFATTSNATETFKVQMRAFSANTKVLDFATAGYPRQFLVEDIGPA